MRQQGRRVKGCEMFEAQGSSACQRTQRTAVHHVLEPLTMGWVMIRLTFGGGAMAAGCC